MEKYLLDTNGAGLGKISCQKLDLSSLQSVREFASEFIKSGRILEGLVNNAGIFQVKGPSSDGYQNVWQTNYLSHAYLTELLLPVSSETFRVVNVSSKLHHLAGAYPLSPNVPPPSDAGDSYFDYAFSKACQVSHVMELERRFKNEMVTTIINNSKYSIRRVAFAVEPGLVNTGIMRESSSIVRYLNYLLLAPILKSVGQGVACTIYCLVANQVEKPISQIGGDDCIQPISGGYYEDCALVDPARYCLDAEDVQMLDRKSKEIVDSFLRKS